jgi:hypothetical protein
MKDENYSTTETVRTYPHLDEAVEMGTSPILEAMESTRGQLDRALRTGTAREKERAHAALTAYRRAFDLYRRLIDLRYEAAGAVVSNIRGGTAINQ